MKDKEKRKNSFICRANKLHNNFYRYDKYIFVNSKTKGIITCPKHGDFEQSMSLHTRKNRPCGCPLCAKEEKRMSFEEFVERSRKIHGEKYEYDKSSYLDSKHKTMIFCKKHQSWFSCTPSNHISNENHNGCPICAKERVTVFKTKPFPLFLEQARQIHGEKYEYDEESYKNANTKMRIFCKKHEIWFNQTPNKHLNGQGCPKCKRSRMETETERILLENSVRFSIQNTFEWLKSSSNTHQYLDFYLSDHKIAIECQGEQHFKPIKRFGGEKKFIRCQENDKNKKKLCSEHGITIFYVNYNDNLREKIEKLLKTKTYPIYY